MKATVPWLAALLIAVAIASQGRADHRWFSWGPPAASSANAFTPADYCCPGWYAPCTWPTFGVQPPCMGFGGSQPTLGAPAHIFARSPRDYFMWADP
jgi:hypothetical protein